MKKCVIASCVGVLFLGAAFAQETPRFSFAAGGGFTQPLAQTGRYLDQGWNVRGGAGVNFNSYLGVMVDAGYNSLGMNSTTLANNGAPGGGVHVFSATLDPVVHLLPKHHVDVYLTGGGGLYRRTLEFTAPTTFTVPAFNPFFGFFPVQVNGTQILSSYSVNKPGFNVGGGVAFGTKWRAKLFAEARYNRMFLGNAHTDFLPATFGVRW
jgi:hypothetical protein